MFEDYRGTIDLEKVLKETYNYQYTGNDFDLIEQPFIELEGDGVDAFIWIKYKNQRYLFKTLKDADYNMWGELLSKQLAKKIGLPSAKYRACKLGEHVGIITENILLNDSKLVLGAQLIQDFLNNYKYCDKFTDPVQSKFFRDLYDLPEYINELDKSKRNKILFNYLNNVEDIWTILVNLDFDKDEIKDIVNGLIKYLIFDCISLQKDRHPNNWGIILENSNYSYLSPLFDNSNSFGLGKNNMHEYVIDFNQEIMNSKWRKDDSILNNMIYDGFPNLTISSDMIMNKHNDKCNHLEVFRTFLRRLSIDDYNKYLYLFNNLDEDIIDELIENVEKENDISIDSNLYLYISYIWKRNIRNLNKIIKECCEVLDDEERIKHMG